MTPLLLSALFPDTDTAELATLAGELGFAGIDLQVHGGPREEDRRAIESLADAGRPAHWLTVDGCHPQRVIEWLQLAGEAGCRAVRTGPWPEDPERTSEQLDRLADAAAGAGVRCLIPNHGMSCFRHPTMLAQFLTDHDPAHLAAALAPDQVPRWRDGDHSAWLARLKLPPLGGLILANYQWVSELGPGNLMLWSTQLAGVTHGLTPWHAWMERVRETGFDAEVSFGDPALGGKLGERLAVVRDDLRYFRRVWNEEGGGGPDHPRED